MQLRRYVGKVGLYVGIVVLVAFCVFPLFWMVSGAFRGAQELHASPPHIIPYKPTLINFIRVLFSTAFPRWLLNSTIVSLSNVSLSIGIATFAAYSLTRFRYPGREKFASFTLFVYMFPPVLLSIPFFLLMNTMNLLDTRIGLVLSYMALTLPYNVWLLRAFFQTIPIELEESAFLDGANRGRVIWSIVLPMALPGIIATSVFSFVVAWNEYLFALVLVSSEELKTLPVGIAGFVGKHILFWEYMLPASVMISVPLLLIFLYVQKLLIAGWGGGAIKG